VAAADLLGEKLDEWLVSLGYTREGQYYRVGKVQHGTIALVSHGGASSAALAHLFNLPFPFVCSAICPDYTAVTVVNFSEQEGALVAPKFELMNDARHIANIEEKKETVYA
jgi:probable phosphoglycerate mutase